MIRVWRPDLEFGDINRRFIICTVGRADSDANTVKNRDRGQAVAKGKLKRISFVSSDEEHCLTVNDVSSHRSSSWIQEGFSQAREVE